MAEENNRVLTRRYVEEVINQGNIHAIDELLDPGIVDYGTPPDFPTGREGAKRFTAMLSSAFPDLDLTIEDMIA